VKSCLGAELPCEGFDGVEHIRDLAFVAGEHHALGECVRDHQKPLHRQITYQDRPTDRDRLVPFLGDLNLRPLVLIRADLAEGAALQPLQEFRLLVRRESDENHDAVTKHHGKPLGSHPQRERRIGQKLALEAGGIDAVADLQRVCGELPCDLGGY